ncbi:MAG: toprim domain-containing protein [bacterium]
MKKNQMANNTHGVDLGDFLDREVYPALYDHLDDAFPEFGFRQKGSAWMATDEKGSRSLPGSPRPDRVYCYRNAPFLLVVQGGERIPILHYATGGRPPRGIDFVNAVRKLAGLAGVSFPEREYTPEERQRTERRERQRDIREAFLAYAHTLLVSDRGTEARAYLEKRGFPAERWEEFGFGLYPTIGEVRDYLSGKEYTPEEIGGAWKEVNEQRAPVGSGLLYDGRWQGRLVGPWRDRAGRVMSVWARDITGTAEAEAKYLFVKVENSDDKPKASPLGLDTAQGRDVVLVEGLLDVLTARVHGLTNVVGLGGAALGKEQITALCGAGVRTVTLNLDHDPQSGAGRAGTLKAINSLAGSSLRVYVVDPALMANPADPTEKMDPDLYVRRHGAEAYRKLLQQARRGVLFGVESLLQKHDLTTDKGKDDAVAALLAYDERLHDGRDTEDLWQLAAEHTGYSYETLAQLALSHTERRERERLNKDLTALLENSARNLAAQETTPEALVQTIAGKLEQMKARAHVDEPPAFSVESLIEHVKNQPDGKRTGWKGVDALGIRFHPGELAVIGARTGHGKTTVLLGLMVNWLLAYWR